MTLRPASKIFLKVLKVGALVAFASQLAGCDDGGGDATSIELSKLDAGDLVADILYYASRGAKTNDGNTVWKKKGDSFVAASSDGFTLTVKISQLGPCLFSLGGSQYKTGQQPPQPTEPDPKIDFSKLRRISTVAQPSPGRGTL